MMKMHAGLGLLTAMLVAGGTVASAQSERNLFEEAPWYAGVGLTFFEFEGDLPIKDSYGIGLRLGYDMHQYFALEGGLDIAPSIGKNDEPGRFQLEDDTSAIRLSLSALAHLRNTQNLRWDPYLAVGGSWTHFADDLEDGADVFGLDAGLGLFYHFNDVWSMRGDYRLAIAGSDTEFAGIGFITVNYRWGAVVPAKLGVTGGDIDSDGDGLLDSEEAYLGTNPFDPDSDKDGLTDYAEVRTHNTDPLNPDSDYDGLNDGSEVLVYTTNPLDPDTDDGGVYDGHEVIEDKTDPLDPSDDLQVFRLNIEFDYDKAVLRPEYHRDLEAVIKVLERDPGATARIEGHADRRPTSKRAYNLRLSERRAQAVLDYLVEAGGIDRSRLEAKGYGFDRPIAPNDNEENMQHNRRTEIYIRRGDASEASPSEGMVLP